MSVTYTPRDIVRVLFTLFSYNARTNINYSLLRSGFVVSHSLDVLGELCVTCDPYLHLSSSFKIFICIKSYMVAELAFLLVGLKSCVMVLLIYVESARHKLFRLNLRNNLT
jgi:hypothetical protein